MAGFCVSGFRVVPPNPPTPPSPPPPASIVTGNTGQFGSGNSFSGPPGNITVDFSVASTTVQAGDLLIAYIVVFHDTGGGVDISNFTGGLPAGWSMVRNDPNPGTGSTHGPMYCGIARHTVTMAEGGTQPVYNFSLSSAGATHNQGIVTVPVVRGASGIENIAITALNNASTGKITAPSVSTPIGNELVIVTGLFGTGSGSTITSDNGLTRAMATNSQANADFYQFSTGTSSLAQGLTCTNTGDAFTAYQVSIAS